MIKADEIKVERNGGKKYSLLRLDYEGCVKFAICVKNENDAEIEIIGGDCDAAVRLFSCVAEQDVRCEHLLDVVQDYRRELIMA